WLKNTIRNTTKRRGERHIAMGIRRGSDGRRKTEDKPTGKYLSLHLAGQGRQKTLLFRWHSF
ncbi:MAG: hypothetical protein NTV01_00620, partial [Bacteroidia bacterium]|nr:hypothetical protein [Bacteroidia bacterium]